MKNVSCLRAVDVWLVSGCFLILQSMPVQSALYRTLDILHYCSPSVSPHDAASYWAFRTLANRRNVYFENLYFTISMVTRKINDKTYENEKYTVSGKKESTVFYV